MPKGIYERTESNKPKKREYPTQIVEMVKQWYLDDRKTVAEIQRLLPSGYKAQRIIERYVPVRRKAAKREQSGHSNHMWKGSEASYKALHLRVATARGKPDWCEHCHTTNDSTRYEWANLTGHYDDITDYARMCVTCHRNFDADRRRKTGQLTTANWR